ncbi:MAG TPA: deoxyribodipyrimidine photo-lyase, partial [Burkholderiaceae bacterium]|nr:deoxyribodipyrimidine photo-lyase [Burkholderiaceae bacterium]
MSDKPLAAALVWLRRDLRVRDNSALHHALHAARRVWCAFVFDAAILDALPRVDAHALAERPVAELAAALAPPPEGVTAGVPALWAIGFEPSNLHALRL